jgi:hypothetical protein
MRKQTQIMYIRRELNGGSLTVFSNVYSSWNVVAFAIMLRNHRNNNVSKQTNKNNVNK